jgi:hypothetical protein
LPSTAPPTTPTAPTAASAAFEATEPPPSRAAAGREVRWGDELRPLALERPLEADRPFEEERPPDEVRGRDVARPFFAAVLLERCADDDLPLFEERVLACAITPSFRSVTTCLCTVRRTPADTASAPV